MHERDSEKHESLPLHQLELSLLLPLGDVVLVYAHTKHLVSCKAAHAFAQSVTEKLIFFHSTHEVRQQLAYFRFHGSERWRSISVHVFNALKSPNTYKISTTHVLL
jgi:hypothetical protein